MFALARPVWGGCSCSRSAARACGPATPQAKHFDDGSVIRVPSDQCTFISVCRYRNCQSNPLLAGAGGMLGHKFHAEGYFEFSFSPGCSFTAGCGLCRPHVHGVSLLASGTHSKMGRSAHYLFWRYLSREHILGEAALISLPPFSYGVGVLALPPSLDCRAVGCGMRSSAQWLGS